ncbi:MAG: carboxy-S-adenosyl-L-methionine synthase CmoA [Pseudomonadota bacterium]
MRDQVYRKNRTHIADFAFTEEVAAVFPDMLRRSVPGYETMIPTTGLLAARHLGNSGLAYDLGCSLGATSLALLQQNDSPDIRVIGVDNSAPMVAGARANITDPRAEFVDADILDTPVNNARVVVLNLVLQFIDPEQRLPLLQRIRQQMQPDGMLLVSEKVKADDPLLQTLYVDTHEAWKQANGYSALEVSQKRTALENVMQIDAESAHLKRFKAAGFSDVQQWYRCLNWASFLVRP